MHIIVIPAYNEEKNMGSLLNNLKAKMAGRDYSVIIVNDGSSDRTGDIVESYSKEMPVKALTREVNNGVGEAFSAGFKEALNNAKDNDIIITIEADNTSDLSILDGMIKGVESGADIALASCYAPGGIVKGISLHRKILSWGANQLVRAIVPIKGIHTFSSFYRAYNAGFLRKASQIYGDKLIEEKGFNCMVELLIKLGKLKPKVVEVPMELICDKRKGKSKMKIASTILSYLRLITMNLLKGRK
jgi:dolichol-phosphate mannosyltransferase